MEDNGLEDEDIDFSIIIAGSQKHKQFDASVNQLLQNPKVQPYPLKQIKTQPCCPQNSIKQQQCKEQGSFMRDLQKMQKQISYQTNPYDIYQKYQKPAQFTRTLQANQQDTCTKTTNNMTKIGQKNIENDFKHLIVDFTEEKISKIKNKQCFQDYFQTQILKTKKIDQKIAGNQLGQKSHKYLPIKKSKNKISCVIGAESKIKQTSKTKSNSLKNSQSVKLLTKTKQLNKLGTKQHFYKSSLMSKQKQKSKSKSMSRSKQSKGRQKFNSKMKNNKQKSAKDKHQKKKTKQIHGIPLKSQVYSEYFGFSNQPETQKKKKTNSSHSKGKKIIFSKKDVNICH